MDLDDAAAAIATALVIGNDFGVVVIEPDGSVTVPQHGAPVELGHHAGVERIAAGLGVTASRPRPAAEPVTVSRDDWRGLRPAAATVWFRWSCMQRPTHGFVQAAAGSALHRVTR